MNYRQEKLSPWCCQPSFFIRQLTLTASLIYLMMPYLYPEKTSERTRFQTSVCTDMDTLYKMKLFSSIFRWSDGGQFASMTICDNFPFFWMDLFHWYPRLEKSCKYLDQKGSVAMLTSIESAGVAPEVNLRITQLRKHTRDSPWLWNLWQTSLEVRNSGISGPQKGLMSSKIFLKRAAGHSHQNKIWSIELLYHDSICYINDKHTQNGSQWSNKVKKASFITKFTQQLIVPIV